MNGALTTRIDRESLKDKCIDIHTHAAGINFTNYYLGAFPYCNNISDLVKNMQINGIDYSVTFPVPTNIDTDNSPDIDRDIRKVIESYERHPYFFENQRLLNESIIFGNGQILPFIMLSLHSKIDEQIESYLELKEKYNIYGFKINPSTDRKNISTLLCNDKLVSLLEEEKLPVMIHSANDDYSSGESCLLLAKELNEVRFCIAHAARLDDKFLDEIICLHNTWFDLSPIIKLYELLKQQRTDYFIGNNINNMYEFITFLCAQFPDKVLFGTDYPWCYCGYLESNIDKNLSNLYEENVKVFKKLPSSTYKRITTNNSIDYLFGK